LHDSLSNKRACLVTAYWYAVLCLRIQKQIVNRNGGNLIFLFTENRIGVLSFPVLIFSNVNYDNDSLFKRILYTKVEVLLFRLVSGSKSAPYISSDSYDMFFCKMSLCDSVRIVALFWRGRCRMHCMRSLIRVRRSIHRLRGLQIAQYT